MSDTVISVENLSKFYFIGHDGPKESYNSLRDTVVRHGKNYVRKALDMARGRQIIQGDSVEEFWALKDVSFEVKRGEVLGIIGRNGAGKSTLLKILSRISEPSAGRVVLDGRVASLLEVGTGFHPELTGRENIFLNGAILGMAKSEIRAKFDEIVAFAEVEKFLDTPVKRYSSGMYVRLAFAVAAHLESEILIVDEVLAVGDMQFQKKCLGKMQEVSYGGRTVLFVSHNMGVLRQLCSQCVMLNGGSIATQGATSDVIESYLRSGCGVSSGGIVKKEPIQEKTGQITEITLMGANEKPTDRFSCDELITIRVRMKLKETIRGMYCWIDFTRTDGTLVWMNDSFDAGVNILDNLSPGNHTISIAVPARTVGQGEYLLNIAVTGPLGDATPVDALESACLFRVEDLTTRRGNRRPGFISACANWRVEKDSA